jgi:hypothetical protein
VNDLPVFGGIFQAQAVVALAEDEPLTDDDDGEEEDLPQEAPPVKRLRQALGTSSTTLSGYQLFVKFAHLHLRDSPLDSRARTKEIGERWQGMPPEAKQTWATAAKALSPSTQFAVADGFDAQQQQLAAEQRWRRR